MLSCVWTTCRRHVIRQGPTDDMRMMCGRHVICQGPADGVQITYVIHTQVYILMSSAHCPWQNFRRLEAYINFRVKKHSCYTILLKMKKRGPGTEARPKFYYVDPPMINLLSCPVSEDGYKGPQSQSTVIICRLLP